MSGRPRLTDRHSGYTFKPHEMPILPGSPANPDHPAGRKIAYLVIGVFLGLVGGAQNGFLLANTAALQGEEAQRTAVADAVRHAQNRYRAGYTPYIEQIDAERSLLAVELSLVQLNADRLNAMIGLYQAVGGAP